MLHARSNWWSPDRHCFMVIKPRGRVTGVLIDVWDNQISGRGWISRVVVLVRFFKWKIESKQFETVQNVVIFTGWSHY
jgi:hypothetical protein